MLNGREFIESSPFLNSISDITPVIFRYIQSTLQLTIFLLITAKLHQI